jgi:DNA-binding cell septation regulator SpoVG
VKITITNVKDREGRTEFDLELYGSASEAFLTIRGCRIISGSKGPFVSWPAKKLDKGWWNHVRSSDAFGAAVLEKAQAAKPAPAKQATNDDDVPW